ncbi:uncharacterized protein LOC129319648 [Prosopis cineraria]|uniref:uncharacterized protein LOC129319648 n=1 Tax=Prosopis cineraria TaxID=364024 RepID=UPI00240F6388|nr:uncharacterized protein LOC129319648 [Prosopis cineraria]
MIIISWNYRGAGCKAFPGIIKDLVQKYKVDILCLQETRISGSKADCVVRCLGFDKWIRLEAIGFFDDWIVLGDFNAFLRADDKLGGSGLTWFSLSDFHNCINDLGLLELLIIGDKYTWEGHNVKERLDWAFCNLSCEFNHPNSKEHHLLKFKSDHKAIAISDVLTHNSPNRPAQFKYQVAWNLEPDFGNLVSNAWLNHDWVDGVSSFQSSINSWNDLKKSRCRWLQWGDKNTKFFYASAVIKKRRKRIEALKNDAGDWIEDSESLKSMASEYYKNLYSKDINAIPDSTWPNYFPQIDSETLLYLNSDVTDIEIKNAAFALDVFKAPGPDGIQAHFFHS